MENSCHLGWRFQSLVLIGGPPLPLVFYRLIKMLCTVMISIVFCSLIIHEFDTGTYGGCIDVDIYPVLE
jgi:hypothetical protein